MCLGLRVPSEIHGMEGAVRFRILGPLEVIDDGGQPVNFTRRLHRSALALLLLNAGRPCSTRNLAAGLWGDVPLLSPEVSLRSCVYGIRKLLPDAGRLRTQPGGYLIVAGPGELDLDDFRELARDGREALDAGDARSAATLLGQAADLWRDPPLADLPALPAHERLLGQRQEARDALTEARLALGEHRQLLTELRDTVASDPLHEHAWAQLITALYRSGARAEALAAFGRLRMTLVSAYGIDPGPELQDLHRRVLADDPHLMLRPAPPPTTPMPALPVRPTGPAVAPAAAGPTLATLKACQLPMAIADLTGRAAELARLRSLLSRKGLSITVVTGMLGVGKTALAVYAGHSAMPTFPDGQLFACLDDGGRPRDPQMVLGELLRGLGVPAVSIPTTTFEREALYRSILAGRRVLLVADGATSAEQVKPLLPGSTGSAVVVTSRARLSDLEGSRLIELGGLSTANSMLLLARISGRNIAGADTEADQDTETEAAAAREIAAVCGNLPLALRIAGARLAGDPELTMTELAYLLSNDGRRLDELAVGQASVRTTLAAAAQGVSAAASHGLALLASGQPDSTGSAITALIRDPRGNNIAPELADAGLLDRTAGHGYRLHPLVRAYANELLAADWSPHSDPASSSRITTRVGERRTTSAKPARS
jgi:DNA-binding SARP family transcriptional activator